MTPKHSENTQKQSVPSNSSALSDDIQLNTVTEMHPTNSVTMNGSLNHDSCLKSGESNSKKSTDLKRTYCKEISNTNSSSCPYLDNTTNQEMTVDPNPSSEERKISPEYINMFSKQGVVQTWSTNDMHLQKAFPTNRTGSFHAGNATAQKV